MNPHNLNHLRHLLESPELTKRHRELRGRISAGTADRRRGVLAQITRRLDPESRDVLVSIREHLAPWLGLNDSPPGYCTGQGLRTDEILKTLVDCGLIVLEVGSHGTYDVGFTPTGLQVALSIR